MTNRNEYRGYTYTIQWLEGAAHYTIYLNQLVLCGIGNHGKAKEIIDTCLAHPERCHI